MRTAQNFRVIKAEMARLVTEMRVIRDTAAAADTKIRGDASRTKGWADDAVRQLRDKALTELGPSIRALQEARKDVAADAPHLRSIQFGLSAMAFHADPVADATIRARHPAEM